jgi:hypothetical protein
MNNPKTITGCMLLTAAVVAAISAFWQDNLVTATLLAALLAVTLWFWHTRRDITHLFIVAIVGPSMEAAYIYFGAWAYSNPTVLIPVWLPIAWGIVGIALPKLTYCFIGPTGQGTRDTRGVSGRGR